MSTHINPACTADIIVEYGGKLVFVERSHEPFKGYLAFPGGFLETGKESIEQTAARELMEETGLEVKPEDLALVCVKSKPNRDPRGHVIAHIYYAKKVSGQPKAGDDAANIKLLTVAEALNANLAFDHTEILTEYLEKNRTSLKTK